MADYGIHTVWCRDLLSFKRCCVSSKGYKWEKAYNKMRWQKGVTNDVHSLIWHYSKTKNKTQLGTQECWPARNINNLKATVLRLHVYQFRGHNKSVRVFQFVCKGSGRRKVPWLLDVWSVMQQASEEQLYRTATGPKPQTVTTAWRHTCSTKPFAARVLKTFWRHVPWWQH